MITEKLSTLKSGLSSKQRIVLVAGSFFPMHRGHVAFLACARELGSVLVVAMNDDEAMGENEFFPDIDETDRAVLLSVLPSVDHVLLIGPMKEIKSVGQAISALRPDVFATGQTHLPAGALDACKGADCDVHCRLGGDPVHG